MLCSHHSYLYQYIPGIFLLVKNPVPYLQSKFIIAVIFGIKLFFKSWYLISLGLSTAPYRWISALLWLPYPPLNWGWKPAIFAPMDRDSF
jgi:hypothetical protein